MASYIGIIHKEPNSDYGVSFPDFPGCISVGGPVEEAKDMATEALTVHIEGMLEDGEPIPEPSLLEEVMRQPDFADGIAMLVTPEDQGSKTVRVNITIPKTLLGRIDGRAKRLSLSRSKYLAAIAQAALERNNGAL